MLTSVGCKVEGATSTHDDQVDGKVGGATSAYVHRVIHEVHSTCDQSSVAARCDPPGASVALPACTAVAPVLCAVFPVSKPTPSELQQSIMTASQRAPAMPPATTADFLWDIHSLLVGNPARSTLDQLKVGYLAYFGYTCPIERFLVVDGADLESAFAKLPRIVTLVQNWELPPVWELSERHHSSSDVDQESLALELALPLQRLSTLDIDDPSNMVGESFSAEKMQDGAPWGAVASEPWPECAAPSVVDCGLSAGSVAAEVIRGASFLKAHVLPQSQGCEVHATLLLLSWFAQGKVVCGVRFSTGQAEEALARCSSHKRLGTLQEGALSYLCSCPSSSSGGLPSHASSR